MTGGTPSALAMYCARDVAAVIALSEASLTTARRKVDIFAASTSLSNVALGPAALTHASADMIFSSDLSQLELRYLSTLPEMRPSSLIFDDAQDLPSSLVATSKVLPSPLLTALLSRIINTNP